MAAMRGFSLTGLGATAMPDLSSTVARHCWLIPCLIYGFNTHGNGDHTFGNQLVKNAHIIATRNCLLDMEARLPDELHELMTTKWRALGEAGAFMHEVIGSRFDFSDIVHTPPTEMFDGEMVLHVGSKEVRLIELGPAHTRGDALVHVPQDRTVFSGDLLFVDGHPVGWADRQLDRCVRQNSVLGRRDNRPRPRPDHRQVRCSRTQAITRVPLCGGTQTV